MGCIESQWTRERGVDVEQELRTGRKVARVTGSASWKGWMAARTLDTAKGSSRLFSPMESWSVPRANQQMLMTCISVA
jgi:hypothetical protein